MGQVEEITSPCSQEEEKEVTSLAQEERISEMPKKRIRHRITMGGKKVNM